MIFEIVAYGFIEQHGVGYINTTLAKVKSKIDMYHTLPNKLNCKLNKCELDQMDFDR
jgi:hypothetical protein